MTVRFKTEYQRNFPQPGPASPVLGVPSAGLRSDQMGTSREPGLQRRRRRGGPTQSCRNLLPPADPGPAQAPGAAPPADLRGGPAHRKEPKPAAASGPADPEPPPAPRPNAGPGPEPPEGLEAGPEPGRPPGPQAGKAGGSHDLQVMSCPQPRPLSGPQPSANQVLNPSRRAVVMETEYRQSYQDPVPPARPRLRKHLEAQRVPLFHLHMSNKKTEASQNEPHHQKTAPPHHREEATSPPQVQRAFRKLTEYRSSFGSPLCRILEDGGASDDHASQVAALRRQARCYRRRAWGENFCREHLNQLRSEHNVLWEAAETASTPPTPQTPPTRDPSHQDAAEEPRLPPTRSSRTDGEAPPDTTEEEKPDQEEEGRLPTPRLKMLPVQRTHHDLTTPAAGGAVLVGRFKSNGEVPADQVVVEAGPVLATPPKCKEAWSEVDATHVTPGVSSPVHEPAEVKSPEAALAPPSLVLAPPPHCIQGSLRKADFQHNGDLRLRFRDPLCPGGGCGSGPDDRLSVMSWRSASSCSQASGVLERARRRRDDFWGR